MGLDGFFESDCERFRRLNSEGRDRVLTEAELNQLDRHRNECAACVHSEQELAMALNMLSGATISVDDSPRSEHRWARSVRADQTKTAVKYWMPALLSAVASAVVIVALLGVIQFEKPKPSAAKNGVSTNREAKLTPRPNLSLETTDRNP